MFLKVTFISVSWVRNLLDRGQYPDRVHSGTPEEQAIHQRSAFLYKASQLCVDDSYICCVSSDTCLAASSRTSLTGSKTV